MDMRTFTVPELGWWIHLLLKLAEESTDSEKRKEHLEQALQCSLMIQEHVGRAFRDTKDSAEMQAPKVETIPAPVVIPKQTDKVGPVYDDDGNIVAISAQKGNPGYDPEISKKDGLTILCNGQQVEMAHTADVRSGIVKYYARDERGRIKTKTIAGKVEIVGI